MKKKTAAILLALIISACSLTACTSESGGNSSVQTSSEATASSVNSAADTAEMFADGDLRDVENETPNAEITLSGGTGTLSDTTRGSSGSEVTITSKGIYEITGSSEDVTIVINDEKKSGNIYLVLSGVTMTNSKKPCIYVKNSEKVIIVSKDGTENTLGYTCEDNADGLDGAVYSEDDITLGGSGKLSVSSAAHGIVCENDFKSLADKVTVNAASVGIKADDSVRIGGGSIVIEAGHDGIQAENKEGTAFLYMEDGSAVITAGYDGIDVKGDGSCAQLLGGTLDITSGGGSDNPKDSETSQKGIKCGGDVIIGETAVVNISSADDALNSAGSVTLGGTVSLTTSDDGITAAGTLSVTGGALDVAKAYEGLEASDVIIEAGAISVNATDDGINASGSDTGEVGMITINDGSVYINASGDGMDSNGSIVMNDGYVIIEGPTDEGNALIDKGDSDDCKAEINGGTLLAIGSSKKAIGFDSGTQPSVLVTLSGTAGTEITVEGTDFSYKTTKDFECVLFSSPDLKKGSAYTIKAGESSAEAQA